MDTPNGNRPQFGPLEVRCVALCDRGLEGEAGSRQLPLAVSNLRITAKDSRLSRPPSSSLGRFFHQAFDTNA